MVFEWPCHLSSTLYSVPLSYHVFSFMDLFFLSIQFRRSLTSVKRGDSRDRWVHLLTGHLRPGKQRLRQLLHPTGALSIISHHRGSTSLPTALEKSHSERCTPDLGDETVISPTHQVSLVFHFQVQSAEQETFFWSERKRCLKRESVRNWDTDFPFARWTFLVFSSVFIVLEVFLAVFFFFFVSPVFPFGEKVDFVFCKILVPRVFLALFGLDGCAFDKSSRNYIETVYSYVCDIHIKHTHAFT